MTATVGDDPPAEAQAIAAPTRTGPLGFNVQRRCPSRLTSPPDHDLNRRRDHTSEGALAAALSRQIRVRGSRRFTEGGPPTGTTITSSCRTRARIRVRASLALPERGHRFSGGAFTDSPISHNLTFRAYGANKIIDRERRRRMVKTSCVQRYAFGVARERRNFDTAPTGQYIQYNPVTDAFLYGAGQGNCPDTRTDQSFPMARPAAQATTSWNPRLQRLGWELGTRLALEHQIFAYDGLPLTSRSLVHRGLNNGTSQL